MEMEQKKNNKLLIILLVVFGLIIIGLGGYIVYDKFITNTDTAENDNGNSKNNPDGNQNLNENLVINLTSEENTKLYDVFANIIEWNWGYNDWSNSPKAFTYFDTDLSRATATFFNNNTLTSKLVKTDSGSEEAVCYKFDELNNLSNKVFGQGISFNAIKDDFHSEFAPEGYICYDGGTVGELTKIKELRLNEKTEIYTLEIINDDPEFFDIDMLYKFEFKIDKNVQLKNIKFDDLSNLSGKKLG